MKRILMSMVLLFSIAICNSQNDYIPLVTENKYCLVFTFFDAEPYPKPSGAILSYFKGDSVHANKPYYKRYTSILSGTHPCPPAQRPCYVVDEPYKMIDTNFVGLFRDDHDEKIVYFLQPGSMDEVELYNFSLNKGDTISEFLLSILPQEYSGLGVIDSVSFDTIGGQIRKILYLEARQQYFPFETYFITIIEGIGYDCIYCEGTLSECNIISSVKEETKVNINELKIYPNPTDYNLTTHIDLILKELFILNLNGEIVLKSQHKEIDVSGLVSGIYIVKCITSENKQYFKKFVKK